MTLHSAKGLEFPLVLLRGMEEGLFPHSRTLTDPAGLEEERRLCYVGMTRAMDTLILTRARYRRRYGNDMPDAALPSRFLEEVPQQLLEDLSGGRERSHSPGATRPGIARDHPAAAAAAITRTASVITATRTKTRVRPLRAAIVIDVNHERPVTDTPVRSRAAMLAPSTTSPVFRSRGGAVPKRPKLGSGAPNGASASRAGSASAIQNMVKAWSSAARATETTRRLQYNSRSSA